MFTYDGPTPYDSLSLYDATLIIPKATPTVPVATPQPITYLFTDLFTGQAIAELPLTNVTFSLALNSPGPFAGTLAVEDPRVTNLDWLDATVPNKTAVWVQAGSTLLYGGIVQGRTYTMSGQQIQIKARDFTSYLAQRLQAKDYSTTWATTPSGAAQIGQTILTDALAVANSVPIGIGVPSATPTGYQIPFSAPITQQQSVGSLVGQLQQLGYLVGFDYACDVGWVSGLPVAVITLSYPRRGRIAGSTGLVVDVANATEFVYPEDGTLQADRVAEMSYLTGGSPTVGVWPAAMTVDKYPLLEAVASHTSLSPVTQPAAVLAAYAQDDLARFAYPAVTPQITIPLFGDPPIGSFIVGDDVRVLVPKTAGGGPPVNPRFPTGMDFYWRVIRADITIVEAGVSTMTLTFNMPLSSSPQRPPQ